MSNPRVLAVPPDHKRDLFLFPPLGLADVMDTGFDFAEWLAQAPADGIASASSVVTATGIGTVTTAPSVVTGTVVTQRIGPATNVATCLLTTTILTTQGRRKTASGWMAIGLSCEVPP